MTRVQYEGSGRGFNTKVQDEGSIRRFRTRVQNEGSGRGFIRRVRTGGSEGGFRTRVHNEGSQRGFRTVLYGFCTKVPCQVLRRSGTFVMNLDYLRYPPQPPRAAEPGRRRVQPMLDGGAAGW